MKIIKVNLGERTYDIVVGTGIIDVLGRYIAKLKIGCNAYVITNASIKNKYGAVLKRALDNSGVDVKFKLVPDTEKSKSLETASSVIKDIALYDKGKQTFIVAFGGGVVGDLAGFIAAIYKRGIPYIQVPTTLLAQVDSSIGGKTGVDLAQGKNLVGAFYQPRLVFSDTEFLKTLDLRQLRSGLAEVIKYAIIKDPQLFSYLEKNYKKILNLNGATLEFIVWRCSNIKAKIIQQDEKEEKGIRTILNFGHTLGHAIEAAAAYAGYNHGEAVSQGMLLACDISGKIGLINEPILTRIENLIKAAGLPARIEKLAAEDIIKAHYRDKKFIGVRNRFVLIEDIGKTKIAENIPLKIIEGVLKKRC